MMTVTLLLYNLKLNLKKKIFSTSLNCSPIIFIRTYIVNYRNALDRLRVRINIILYLFRIMPIFYCCLLTFICIVITNCTPNTRELG